MVVVKLSHSFLKLVLIVLAKGGDKTFFLHVTRSDDQWVTWLDGWDSLTLNYKGCGKNKNMYVLQIEATFCYISGSFVLLQIRANIVTNWAVITN